MSDSLGRDKLNKFLVEKTVFTMEAGEIGYVLSVLFRSVLDEMGQYDLFLRADAKVFESKGVSEISIHNPWIKVRCVIPRTSYIVYLNDFTGKIDVYLGKMRVNPNMDTVSGGGTLWADECTIEQKTSLVYYKINVIEQ